MGKEKSRKSGPRHSSVTPQKTNNLMQNIVDLTKTDPWAYQAKKAKRAQSIGHAPASKPTPLLPAFSGKQSGEWGSASRPATIINVPQDPNQSPAYVLQQVALAKNRANVRPSFFGAVRLNDSEESSKSDATARDETPTPGQKQVNDQGQNKDKKKKAKEGKDKEKKQDDDKGKEKSTQGTKPHDQVEEAKRKEKKKKRREEMELQTARAVAIQAAAANESRKRKREDDEAEAFKRRVEVEANAVKKLRETLPTIRLERVTHMLERDEGAKPTEMAVLLTAARDTILDLAKQQVMQTERISSVLQTELVKVLNMQQAKLAELKGNENTIAVPVAAAATRKEVELIDDTSSSGSDDNSSDDQDEEGEEKKSTAGKGAKKSSQAPKTLDRCPTQ